MSSIGFNTVRGGIPRIAITPGEPAGIGPDLVLSLARENWPAELVVIADPDLMNSRAGQLDAGIRLQTFQKNRDPVPTAGGCLMVWPTELVTPSEAGRLEPSNSAYVLNTLTRACDGCLAGDFQAMVTGPVHKGVINDSGVAFFGHTEFLAGRTHTPLPVMLLVADRNNDPLRVALVTTHLALREVPEAIDAQSIENVLRVLNRGLMELFGIARPRISVLGMNPHAGESGHLGREEEQIIRPTLDRLRAEGFRLKGPLPADTAFTPRHLKQCDTVLAMYHDQGLPVLKHAGFGRSVNVTLGLPIIRTSVDHGTALNLAGTGQADSGSLRAALNLAIKLIRLSSRRSGILPRYV